MRRVVSVIFVVAIAVVACTGSPAEQAGTGDVPTGTVRVVASPAIPATVREIPNPLRGQYEALSQPLFPQGNPAQRIYPDWPGSFDAGIRVPWRRLQPTDPRTLAPNAPDDIKYDFSEIDDALQEFSARGMRLMLRVHAYNSCCASSYPDNTNAAVPDWLATIPGAVSRYPSESDGGEVTHVVPNWNDPAYLAGFEELLAALGRRYDGDERLSVFEFSGYGDFSENHIGYLRDRLAAAGPEPDDSAQTLGYFSQWRDQSITRASVSRLVRANVAAFPRTQMVVTPQNPEIIRQLFAGSVDMSAPVGIRSDCLGVYPPVPAWAGQADSRYVIDGDPLVDRLMQRFSVSPVITEWCEQRAGISSRAYYEKGLRDVLAFHVSMTSSHNFPDSDAEVPMDPELFGLWSRANAFAGYRYSVEGVDAAGSATSEIVSMEAMWTNHGSAAVTEKWSAGYRLVDHTGTVVRTVPSSVDLKALVGEQDSATPLDVPLPDSVTEPVRFEAAGLPPGRYTISAGVIWDQHKPQATHTVDYPPMHLARDGRDGGGWYPIATVDLP